MNEWSGAGHMFGMWVWWLIVIGIIMVIVWASMRMSTRSSNDSGASAEELLKRRYASGEIDKQEYENRLRDLRQ